VAGKAALGCFSWAQQLAQPKLAFKPKAAFQLPECSMHGCIVVSLTYPQVARQKLPHDWNKRLQAIQAKVSEAVKEVPAGLLAQLAGSAEVPVDYFRSVQIRDKLAETGERSLFGGLTGQAGTWDKIVKAYENGGKPGQKCSFVNCQRS